MLIEASDEGGRMQWSINKDILCGYGSEPDTAADGLVGLVHSLMELDPDYRPTAKEALQHPFLNI